MSEQVKEKGFLVGLLMGIALSILAVAFFSGCMHTTEWDPNEDACILGGYATWTMTGPEKNGLCIGVVDGEWQIEPLDTVRDRLGDK